MLQNLQDTEFEFSEQDSLLLLESSTSRTTSFRTPGRKRIHKTSKIQQILNNLPTGVKYIGPEGGMTEEKVLAYAKNPAAFDLG